MDAPMPTDYRAKLQALLRELFQFDSADLDFGIYRIMNQKRAEVETFIQKDLLDTVGKAFEEFAQGVSRNAQAELQVLEKKVRDALGDAAFDDAGGILAPYQQLPLSLQYTAKCEEAKVVAVSAEQEAQVFNDLYTFFARYYSEGDFITLRHYGRDKYAIPYNGEEVLLHWANRDQYYVKTAETFRDYVFKIQPGGYTVYFKLMAAETEQNNVKGENRYFIPRGKSPIAMDAGSKTCTIFFEYRPLTAEEKETYGTKKVQDTINEAVAPQLWKAIDDKTLRGLLATADEHEQTILYRHLSKYTRRNTSDYFIHKHLRDSLQRELDFYIKNEIFRLDDLGGDLDPAEEPTRRLLARAKVVRHLGRQMIEFLAQIEDFQKQLFEKKKFVTQTEWCITLDHVAEEFFPEIIVNKAQWAEWESLFKIKRPKGNDKATTQFLRDHPSLVLDTQFFDADFKDRLLASIEKLDEQTSGVLIHGENFQALNLLLERYRESVKGVYIDPPYNTAATEIIYKNGYKHSSWLALMQDRLELSRKFLSEDGIACITIDDYEIHYLRELLEGVFGEDNYLATAAIRNNPSGRSTVKGFAINHEYGLFFAKDYEQAILGRLPHSEEQKGRYSFEAEDGRHFEWENFRKNSTGSYRADRPKQFYPIYYHAAKNTLRIPDLEWQNASKSYKVLEKPSKGEVALWPLDSSGVERVWRFGIERARKEIKDLMAEQSRGNIEVYKKKYLQEEGLLPRTWWDNAAYSARDNGTRALVDLFGSQKGFDFPKSTEAVKDCIKVCASDGDAVILDYFAGSGTTAHAVINLNQDDEESSRKFILVEMGEYFDTVLKPRVEKVIYASEWKNGEPVEGAAGVSNIFKYQRLESYEDTLNNLVFDPALKPQPELLPAFTDYMLRYMLDHETRNSGPRLNVDKLAHPFDYTLNLARQGETVETKIDLIETFNYLLGLTVTRRLAYADHGCVYRVVLGTLGQDNVAIIWRDLAGLDLEQDKDFITSAILNSLAPDRIYINGDSYVPGAESLDPIFKQRMAG
jgi:adenine-specific DNA-methyltransferase